MTKNIHAILEDCATNCPLIQPAFSPTSGLHSLDVALDPEDFGSWGDGSMLAEAVEALRRTAKGFVGRPTELLGFELVLDPEDQKRRGAPVVRVRAWVRETI